MEVKHWINDATEGKINFIKIYIVPAQYNDLTWSNIVIQYGEEKVNRRLITLWSDGKS